MTKKGDSFKQVAGASNAFSSKRTRRGTIAVPKVSELAPQDSIEDHFTRLEN